MCNVSGVVEIRGVGMLNEVNLLHRFHLFHLACPFLRLKLGGLDCDELIQLKMMEVVSLIGIQGSEKSNPEK